MKRIILIFIALANSAFSNTATQWELKANEAIFKNGFESGIKALEFQRKNDGYKPKKIAINKEFYITYDITNLPYEEALFLQNIAAREGFDTHIAKTLLYFGEFEREADALKSIDDLKQKFKIEAKLNKNKGGEFLITYPKLWGEFFTFFMEEAKANGILQVTEYITTQQKMNIESNKAQTKSAQQSAQAINQQPVKPKTFTFKNSKAMLYKKSGSGLESKDYIEGGLVENKVFNLGNYGKPVITKQGEKFYKVLGEDSYFSDKDVVIKDK